MSAIIIDVGWFLAGAFFMLLCLLALAERRDDVPAEPVTRPEPVPEPVPVPVAAVEVEPEPAVEPVETVVPMKVIPVWPKRVEEPEPVPVAWRRRLELETAPMCGRLPAHESTWRFDGWKLDDPQRTQMMPIIGGVVADELDMDLGEPKPLPGFQVGPDTQRRFERNESEMHALAVAQGFPVEVGAR